LIFKDGVYSWFLVGRLGGVSGWPVNPSTELPILIMTFSTTSQHPGLVIPQSRRL
jgi:hypothetical protein